MGTESSGRFGKRYEIVRTIGEGGMGVVYEALDRDRGTRVALKTMQWLDPTALYRFKQEFRALTDVAHPNLVALHELVTENEQTFFTMELVDGVDIHTWVRPNNRRSRRAFELTAAAPTPDGALLASGSSALATPSVRAACTADLERLRAAFGQLAEGVTALHEAGRLHRDLKPPNVMATDEGRVVVLDFGLVASLAEDERTVERNIVGTPDYMSPEQAAGSELTEASDWYSVGVMLYEVLTGTTPFQGGPLKILLDKQQFDPTPPGQIVDGVPEDLETLCVALLRRQPAQRPSGADVRACLAGTAAPSKRAPSISSQTMGAAFVGREAHTRQLADSFESVATGKAVAVLVRGTSGMGKSSLVKRFVDLLTQTGDAVVLSGRCYERESVPFKAFDSVVDALSRYLRKLKRHEAEALLPVEIHSLTRLFPVLQRIEAVSAMPRRAFEVTDPQEARRRAFIALRELVARITVRHPLVIWVDDLQWGDVDSVGIFRELLRPPDAPPFLLLASYRDEDAAITPLVKDLLEARAEGTLDVREIEVGPLQPSDALALASSLLGIQDPATRAQAEVIAAESHGSPLFVDELVRYLRSSEEVDTRLGSTLRLDDVLYQRVAALPADARRLLEVIAVAGHPLERTAAAATAELEGEAEATALAVLRVGRLARTSRVHGGPYAVESFHDRVRETIVARLSPEALAAWHARLALVLVSSERPDAEALVVHFHAGGDPARAGEFAAVAAAKAVQALAFDRAAQLWRQALELSQLEGAAACQTRWKLGDALANAGRGAEAAEAYLAALDGASVRDQLELRRRAAEQLLRSGRITDGMAAIREVLAHVGMPLPENVWLVLLMLFVTAMRLTLRGFSFQRRDASQISAEELSRIDICWSVASSLAAVRPISAQVFQKRHLLLALSAGEPKRVAFGLANQASASSTRGGAGRKRTAALVERCNTLVRELDDPYCSVWAAGHHGIAAYLEGRFREARRLLDDGMKLMRDRCTGVAWESAQGLIWSSYAVFHLGDLAELSRQVPTLLQEARQRGDVYLSTNIRLSVLNSVWLAANDPDRARRELQDAMAQWGSPEQQLQQYHELIALVQIDLYVGDGTPGLREIEHRWRALGAAHLMRVQFVRIELWHLRARAAIAAVAGAGDAKTRDALLRRASRDARAIARERMAWGIPLAQLIDAAVLTARGERTRAAGLLGAASTALDAADMRLWAAAARRAHGQLIGDAEGRALVAAADASFRAESVKDPARFAAMLVPGTF